MQFTTDPGNVLFRVGGEGTFSFDSSFDPEEETSTFADDWITSQGRGHRDPFALATVCDVAVRRGQESCSSWPVAVVGVVPAPGLGCLPGSGRTGGGASDVTPPRVLRDWPGLVTWLRDSPEPA